MALHIYTPCGQTLLVQASSYFSSTTASWLRVQMCLFGGIMVECRPAEFYNEEGVMWDVGDTNALCGEENGNHQQFYRGSPAINRKGCNSEYALHSAFLGSLELVLFRQRVCKTLQVSSGDSEIS